MRRHHRFLAASLAFVILAAVTRGDDLPRGDARSQGFSPEKIESIPALLKDAVGKKQIAGGVALVARRGRIIHVSTAGLQDIENKTPMTNGVIFRIASMSKPITSVAVMQLVEDGKLKLTDTLSKYVPEFKEMKVAVPSLDGKSFESVKAEREITIHDLLTHSSGITYRIMSKPHVGKLYEEAGVCDGILLLEARDLNHASALMSKHPAARMWPTTFEIRPANEAMNRLVSERSAAVAKEA